MVALQPKADALDIVTQFVSLLSIILAQYVYIERYSYAAASGGNNGKAVATVLFVGSNAVLLLVHLFLIGGPLWDKTKTAFLDASILWGNKQQDATPGTFSSKQRLDMILTRHPCHSDFLLVNLFSSFVTDPATMSESLPLPFRPHGQSRPWLPSVLLSQQQCTIGFRALVTDPSCLLVRRKRQKYTCLFIS